MLSIIIAVFPIVLLTLAFLVVFRVIKQRRYIHRTGFLIVAIQAFANMLIIAWGKRRSAEIWTRRPSDPPLSEIRSQIEIYSDYFYNSPEAITAYSVVFIILFLICVAMAIKMPKESSAA
jgi:hypothetical protein